MILVDVDLESGSQALGDARLVRRLGEVDLEEGRVADVVAVEGGALADDDKGDVLLLLLVVP